jgi:glycosyltransferase involved in cell wall biosynthesis
MSVWISHPTGNSFVRALLAELRRRGADFRFFTSLGFARPGAAAGRRDYDLPAANLRTFPWVEALRLAHHAVFRTPPPPDRPWSIDAVYRSADARVARDLRREGKPPETIYAYEDGALEQFRAGAELGVHRVYDLPIAYWETTRRLLQEEAGRLPEWEPTLVSTRDSEEKLARKTEELELADCVVCPSDFVRSSLPSRALVRKQCIVSPFGSPASALAAPRLKRAPGARLQVLFAGSLTQRKGLADLFEAMRLLRRDDVELHVAGAPVLPLEFYRRQFAEFRYSAPRAHEDFLDLMRQADLLVLPSIVEGRALVQQEALACGLPLLVTRNAGGADLIQPGKTGFLLPPRSPQAIAERLDWFASNREALEEMRPHCIRKAAEHTWERYAARILDELNIRPPEAEAGKTAFWHLDAEARRAPARAQPSGETDRGTSSLNRV